MADGSAVECDPNQGQLNGKSCLSNGQTVSCSNGLHCLPKRPGIHFPCFSSTTTTTSTTAATTTTASADTAEDSAPQSLQCLRYGKSDEAVNWITCSSIMCSTSLTERFPCVTTESKFKAEKCQRDAGGNQANCFNGVWCARSPNEIQHPDKWIQCATK